MDNTIRFAEILSAYKIGATDIKEKVGKTVTLYVFKPDLGVRISRIRNLKDEIAVALGVSSVRVIAPMADGLVGVEVPNRKREILHAEEIFSSWEYENTSAILPCAFGKTVSDDVFITDLATMPHLLIAGATGQGKSVGLNVLLMSLMRAKSPDELRLMLIDPKQVELTVYNKLKGTYLTTPVITEAHDAEGYLRAMCAIMDNRYNQLCDAKVRNIEEYNAKMPKEKSLPYVVVVIDEYGDFIMTSGKKIEYYICRLAQKARAVGIHLIISTQRPEAKIVTGNIKANFPTRVAFRTTTYTDSRVILDRTGAEKLTGNGDMLYFAGAETTRVQCAYASIDEVSALCDELAERYAGFVERETEERTILSAPPMTQDEADLDALHKVRYAQFLEKEAERERERKMMGY